MSGGMSALWITWAVAGLVTLTYEGNGELTVWIVFGAYSVICAVAIAAFDRRRAVVGALGKILKPGKTP